MMLAALPGRTGDGEARSITNVDGVSSSTVTRYVGASGGEKKIRVNIQHPGEATAPDFSTSAFGSHWPDGGVSRPRSATIVITRDDGGIIGAD